MKEKNNIVFDLILLEADRVINRRKKNLDLYYKDGDEYRKLAETYEAEADVLVENLLRRKKMRYVISFVESL